MIINFISYICIMYKQIENLDYEINPEGIVRRISTKRVKKSFERSDGYIGIQLYKSKTEIKNFQLHRLIAIAFIDNPNNKGFINHIDSNRKNNSLDNLEWVTCQENVKHGYKFGYAFNKGSRNGFSRLNETQVLEIRKKRMKNKLTYKELAKMYNISSGCIAGIIQRINWKHI
jgi:hypothetical protein